MKTGVPGPEGSLGKWQWADLNQALMELAMELEGPVQPARPDGSEYAISDGDWQYGFLRSRANSIEGGTTEILKNIVAERVLGLPEAAVRRTSVNFDLTDEQQMLQGAAREFLASRAQVRADARGHWPSPTTHSTRDLWHEMSELNWPGLMVSEDARWPGASGRSSWSS